MSYLPLARRYRPTKFADLVGQEVLTKTLSHAITSNKIAQSYLLSGIRGVGKTTSARIIAKTINCTNLKDLVPCDECSNCLGFNKNSHPDIVEIDAASRTSVDDVRSIIESSEYRPLLGKFKVFIIDEVHMISKSAFNALLKTLEEPPTGVLFIFATTEVNKIPLTIISRCQRFDLRRLTTDELILLLKAISEAESIEFDEDALALIASKADGSARDAISMLDQAAATAANSTIKLEDVAKMIGAGDLSVTIDFLKAIINRDSLTVIKILQKIYLTNSDLVSFFESIIDMIGYSSKMRAMDGYKLPEYATYQETITNLIKEIDLGKLSILWQIFTKGVLELKESHNQLLASEMLALKAIYASGLPKPEDLVNKAIKSGLPRPDGE
jgi:DNA polymerase-3 subunit gamma/tau